MSPIFLEIVGSRPFLVCVMKIIYRIVLRQTSNLSKTVLHIGVNTALSHMVTRASTCKTVLRRVGVIITSYPTPIRQKPLFIRTTVAIRRMIKCRTLKLSETVFCKWSNIYCSASPCRNLLAQLSSKGRETVEFFVDSLVTKFQSLETDLLTRGNYNLHCIALTNTVVTKVRSESSYQSSWNTLHWDL